MNFMRQLPYPQKNSPGYKSNATGQKAGRMSMVVVEEKTCYAYPCREATQETFIDVSKKRGSSQVKCLPYMKNLSR
jgi:hypothetical protein